MHIYRNHLIAGCVDKASFGKHGLLHIFYELYGPERTSTVTAALSRLFTAFLQGHGFTCGMSDVWLVQRAERERAALLATADVRCMDAAAKFVGMLGPQELVDAGMSLVGAQGGVQGWCRAGAGREGAEGPGPAAAHSAMPPTRSSPLLPCARVCL